MDRPYHYCAMRYRNKQFDNFDINEGVVRLGESCFVNSEAANESMIKLRRGIASIIQKQSGLPCHHTDVSITSLTRL